MSNSFDVLPEPEKPVTWDELQKGISPDTGLEDVPGFTKEASFSSEPSRAESDTLFAGSGLFNEQLEAERHVEALMDENLPYVAIEKSMRQMGYSVPAIRRAFQRQTGIDPVRAYLDVANYPVPPGAVPRYNYGWGIAKESSADYLFILPWATKYGLFKQTGLSRELLEEFWTVQEARDTLKGKVKTRLDVTPEMADAVSAEAETAGHFIAVVAARSKLSELGLKLYDQLEPIAKAEPDLVAKAAIDALDNERITPQDFKIISGLVLMATESSPVDMEKLAAPLPLSAPERIDYKQFEEFRENQEARSYRELKDNATTPGQMLSEHWQSRNQVDMWSAMLNAKKLFDEVSSTLEGYRLTPSIGGFHQMPTPNLALDDDNHIVDGSITIGCTVQRLNDNSQSEIGVMMFIHNGKLLFTGKFKGINNREYALSTIGLDAFFEDIEGSTALDEEIERGMGTMPQMPEQQGPSSFSTNR